MQGAFFITLSLLAFSISAVTASAASSASAHFMRVAAHDPVDPSAQSNRGRLGVAIQDVTSELAPSFGLETPAGALIARVDAQSPAAAAGLRPGDIVVRYSGEPVHDANELRRLVSGTQPGTPAKLEIWRDRTVQQVDVKIGAFDGAMSRAPAAVPRANRLGLTVRVLPAEARRALGVEFGLVVERIDPAARAPQLNPGDVIVGINNLEFESLEHFNSIVAQQRPGTSVALLVRRGDAALYIPVKVQG